MKIISKSRLVSLKKKTNIKNNPFEDAEQEQKSLNPQKIPFSQATPKTNWPSSLGEGK